MNRLYNKLYVTVLNQPKDSSPYRYLILNGGTSEIAFRHKTSFKRWLNERGLTLKPALCWGKGARAFHIVGSYIDVSMMDVEAFDLLNAPTTKVMSSGSYTLAKILHDGDCPSIVHLDCNVSRATFDYWKTVETHG